MFDYEVCFGGMLRGYASGYASRSVKTKVVAFPEGMLQGMLRGYASGYASRSVKTKVVAFPEGMLQGMLRGMLRLSRTSQPYINWTP